MYFILSKLSYTHVCINLNNNKTISKTRNNLKPNDKGYHNILIIVTKVSVVLILNTQLQYGS